MGGGGSHPAGVPCGSGDWVRGRAGGNEEGREQEEQSQEGQEIVVERGTEHDQEYAEDHEILVQGPIRWRFPSL